MVTRLLLPLDNPDVGNNYNKLLKNKTVNKIPSTLHIPFRCCLVLFLQFSYFSLFTIKAAYSYSRRNHFAPVVQKERYSILCSFNGSWNYTTCGTSIRKITWHLHRNSHTRNYKTSKCESALTLACCCWSLYNPNPYLLHGNFSGKSVPYMQSIKIWFNVSQADMKILKTSRS